ncbi:MAG TPA: hypothetical protein VLS89_01115 [Candidatus Nanopelagicales bacterium]|nr:hypothetical protein [Candidatus Nanopelagicales bacterium]
MNRRWAAIAAAAVLLGGAVVVGRSCQERQPDKKAATEAQSVGPVSAGPKAGRKPKPGGTAAPAAPEAGAPAGPEVLFNAGWGGKLGELGRDRPDEGNPEGPMSLAVDAKGRVLVLDQVNNRMVRYGADGKPQAELRTDIRTAQDVVVAPDGTAAVLERVHQKSVTLFDESGKPVGQLPLIGEGIDEAGAVTGVFVDGKDVYAEREHGMLVKIGDTAGNPAEPRAEIPGRPSRDGQLYLSAGIIQAQAGRAYVSAIDRARMENRFTRELRFDARLLTIVLLDSDRSGTIYFAAQIDEGEGQESVVLTCLEPLTGQPIGGAVMPANTLPEETFRDLAVLDDGGVIYALRTEQGTSYQRYACE